MNLEKPCKLHLYRISRKWWKKNKGPIPNGLFVLHHCDVAECYEETHLYLGTRKDNAQDAVRRGRARVPTRAMVEKSAAKRRGLPLSAEHREKLAKAKRGRKLSEGHREHIGQSLRLAYLEGRR